MSWFLNKVFELGKQPPNSSESSAPKMSPGDGWKATELGKLILAIDEEMEAAVKNGFSYLREPFSPAKSETFNTLMKDRERAANLARFLFQNRNEIFVTVRGQRAWDMSYWMGFATFTSLMRSTLPIIPRSF